MSTSILFITPRFGSIGRGVEISCHEIAKRLAASGRRVSILSGRHEVELPGVTMIRLPVWRREVLARLMPRGPLAKAAGRLHLGPTELESLSLLLQARSKRSALGDYDVVIPQGGLALTRWARSRWPKAKLVCVGQAGVVPKELRHADAFIAMIAEDARAAKARFPDLPVATIPHGVDLSEFHPATAPSKDPHLLCVGALTDGKGHRYLFDAFLHLPPSTVLTCLGRGPNEEELKKHPAYATGRVRLLSVDHEEMPAIYRNARAFTLAAPDEVLGIVFLEAMASGLPIVAHDGSRQHDVIGENGFFADVRNPKSYAAALLSALDAGPAAARRRQVEHLGWDGVARRYTEFIDGASG